MIDTHQIKLKILDGQDQTASKLVILQVNEDPDISKLVEVRIPHCHMLTNQEKGLARDEMLLYLGNLADNINIRNIYKDHLSQVMFYAV